MSDAIALIRPVDTLGLGLVTGTPRTLLEAMSKRDDWVDLTVSGGLILGNYDLFRHPGVHYRATFYGAGERLYRDQGTDIQFIPSFFRHYGLLCRDINARVMMMQASMPDASGEVSLSLYSGAHLEECRRAGRDPHRLLILECSPHFPRTRALEGHPHTLHLDEVDVIVVTDARPTALAKEEGSEADRLIAQHSMNFIPEGATLQTGIGAVPNLVALALAAGSGGDYGVHSEMFTDGLHQLYAAGKITNNRKNIHRGYSVTTFALGSAELYEFLDENEGVRFAPVTYTNDPAVIVQNPQMVSINSALEVDLQGQILAEALGVRQFSGTGGHMDFMEGTSLSREHCSIIALQSTAVVGGALKSRIAAGLGPHSVVTSPRQLAQVVVTEFGAADLRGRSVRERAHALAEISHPEFRDELRESAELLGR
ncbi:MAG: 4-hydroxybutyrate CoA-transferase [Acidimicrobiaceae bacterium]|nr:4-hydroxybutyrate CoA-transferase [Acidimicrobiaceae bacterium]